VALAVHSARGAKKKPRPQVAEMNTLPSPIQGIDGRIPVSANNPNVCLYSYNLVPSEYGVQVRNGYREWQIDVPDVTSQGVGTIIPFTAGDGSHKLFAATADGIYDVTVLGGTPALKVAFTLQDTGAGKGVYTHYISDAGADYIFYADRVNGLYRYDFDIDTWQVAPSITGVAVGLIDFVVSHKLRLWFCARDSAEGFYLPINSIQGAAASFSWGSTFKHGGDLIGLYSWTVDGGEGVDDYLVGISRSGDVIPFKGSDPTQADWATVGTYFVGAMPAGNRSASQYGGNVTLLSAFGVTQLSDLLRGVDPRVAGEDTIGAKIASLIRTDMAQYRNDEGWDIKYIPAEGSIIITSPQKLSGVWLQYVYNIPVQGWGFWREVPVTSMDTWQGVTYFGTPDGRVCVMDVSKDNVLLTPPPEDEFNGSPINFSLLTSYGNFGSPSAFKVGQMVRPDFLSKGTVTFSAVFKYDYDLGQEVYGGDGGDSAASTWDGAFWDSAYWVDNQLTNYNQVGGGAGIGRYVAVAITGSAPADTVLASMDVFWTVGGSL
jgi:hypothetical protein